jgi:hypothetical protein
MHTTTKTIEIEIEDDVIEVDLTGELSLENDGIGSYEYWGSKCYDAGTNYFELENLKWDMSLYTDDENKSISNYINVTDNWDSIEESMSESLYDSLDDGNDTDYDRDFGGVDW